MSYNLECWALENKKKKKKVISVRRGDRVGYVRLPKKERLKIVYLQKQLDIALTDKGKQHLRWHGYVNNILWSELIKDVSATKSRKLHQKQ